jgi:release factor glutamine methyltransferase
MSTLAQLLADAGLPRLEAQLLLHMAGGGNRVTQLTWPEREASAEVAQRFAALCARRHAGEPIAYLLGEREFFGLDLAVSPAVLIPRPDTEILVELALARAPQNARVIDLGTGSGCIPVTLKLERPDLELSALDLSPAALETARSNAERLGAAVRFLQSDWLAAVSNESFDLIVSNPPYIHRDDAHLAKGDLRFEPRSALTDEEDGLAHLRHIVSTARAQLTPGGWLLLEHGWDQGADCRALLKQAGYANVTTWQDLGGNDRVSGGQR